MLVDGIAGGGLVKVTLTAKGALRSVAIDPSLFKPDEREIVEDLIVAAHEEARRKAERRDGRKNERRDRRPVAAARHEAAVLVLAF